MTNDLQDFLRLSYGELEELNLNKTQITDDGLAYVSAHKKLQVIAIKDTAVSLEGYLDLKAALPDCTIDWP